MSDTSESTSETTDAETSTEEAVDKSAGKQDRGLQQALAAERKQRQELAARLAEIEAAQKKREEEAAAKRGEFEQLYTSSKTELEKAQARLAELEAAEKARIERLTASNAEALKALPENLRALVPDGLDPEAASAQIAKLAALVQRETPTGGIPPLTPPAGEAPIPKQYRDRAEREAQMYDMDAKTYWRVRLRPRLEREGKLKG